jgi:hypothetical protein
LFFFPKQGACLFGLSATSQIKSATSNQPAILFLRTNQNQPPASLRKPDVSTTQNIENGRFTSLDGFKSGFADVKRSAELTTRKFRTGFNEEQ